MQSQKWLAWLLLGAIGLTFVFWGGTSSFDFSGVSGTTAAEVDGVKIPASEATRAWSETQANWTRQLGTDIPPERRVAIQKNILDGLVMRKLIEKRLDDSHYRVS
ncbi:MAG: SurA N-terminal domain-containing protein, partial [Steroidobacteraceae bacterium]|nr:SurA N-terminal domain-containing protein [Steroidobacteraceae bacterium]